MRTHPLQLLCCCFGLYSQKTTCGKVVLFGGVADYEENRTHTVSETMEVGVAWHAPACLPCPKRCTAIAFQTGVGRSALGFGLPAAVPEATAQQEPRIIFSSGLDLDLQHSSMSSSTQRQKCLDQSNVNILLCMDRNTRK